MTTAKKYNYFVIKKYADTDATVILTKKIVGMKKNIILKTASQNDLKCLYDIDHPFVGRKEIKDIEKKND